MTKRLINEFTIIAARELTNGDIIIFGHKADTYGHEYVVARVESLDATSWYSGDYSRHFPTAIAHFNRRSGQDA